MRRRVSYQFGIIAEGAPGVRELRSDSPGLPRPRVSIEDGSIVVDDDGTVARLRVPFGIQAGETFKATFEVPPGGKLFCTLMGPAEEV